MGRTLPTPTTQAEILASRLAPYREALLPRDRPAFDALLLKARRHAAAASMLPLADEEIPLILGMLVELQKEIDILKDEHPPFTTKLEDFASSDAEDQVTRNED